MDEHEDGAPSGAADLLVRFDNAPGSLAAKLRDAVRSEVEAHSSAIPGLDCDA